MTFRRNILIAILLALLTPMALSLLSGCDSKPDAPDFNNPFDPNGPYGGDPFELIAALGDTSITLIWNNIQGFDLATYEVLHSLSFFGEFFSIGTIEIPDQEDANFIYADPDPTTSHYFKIQAYDSQGNFTLTSYITPVVATTLARVVIDEGGTQAASRHINIRINVTSGDSLRISQAGHPESETVLPADDTGAPVLLAWDLGAVSSNDTTLTINVAVQNNSSLGDTNKVVLDVNFSPTFALSQGGNRVAELYPPFTIKSDGVLSMRFADTLENLDDQPWIDGTDTYSDYLLVDTANPQTIHAEFLGDFGFSAFRQFVVSPDILTEVSFHLNLTPDHISDTTVVEAISDANATLMRFSESLDFTTIPWVAYSDTSTITLSPGPGEKTIYAQFRNDFADSPILTDYVIHLTQPVEVAITAPSENDLLLGGGFLRVQGTATAPSGIALVDSVRFDGGDGFVAVEGTNNWTIMWQVPQFDEDTDLTIRARAWSGGESATATMNVVVSQLIVGINSPADGDTVFSNTDVEVSGFAFPATGGAAVDSVTVGIGGEVGLAVGTEAWSFGWHVGAVDEITEVVVEATAFAGINQHSTQTTIKIGP